MQETEFEEIAHTGGTITFDHDSEKGTAIQITHRNPWAMAMQEVCISYEGKVLDFVPCGGIGRIIPYPQPSILAFLISDKEGLFGRHCPRCGSYFRSNFLTSPTHCPYCGHKADKGVAFLTENQLRFLTEFCNTFIKAHTEGRTISVDLDTLIDSLPGNKLGWVYSEERQQTKQKCQKCRCVYDILGEFGICPACGTSNFKQAIETKLAALEAQFKASDETVEDRNEREIEWEKLTRCVSEFEALGNAIRIHLLKLPQTPKRKADLSQLSFQRVINAAERIKEWFGFDYLEGVSAEDKQFLSVMFNKRHVFTHNAGRVDQEYIDNTGDTSVRINQVLRLRSKEIRRLLPLVRLISQNFVAGLSSIK